LQALVWVTFTSLAGMLGAAACVLLIACANVANLFAGARDDAAKEMALRSPRRCQLPAACASCRLESVLPPAGRWTGLAVWVGFADRWESKLRAHQVD
jgi:hypothetical protein